jgi:hypothetical protein
LNTVTLSPPLQSIQVPPPAAELKVKCRGLAGVRVCPTARSLPSPSIAKVAMVGGPRFAT